jgi:hypothetical protein
MLHSFTSPVKPFADVSDALPVQEHVKALARVLANAQIDKEVRNSIITLCSFFMIFQPHVSC